MIRKIRRFVRRYAFGFAALSLLMTMYLCIEVAKPGLQLIEAIAAGLSACTTVELTMLATRQEMKK